MIKKVFYRSAGFRERVMLILAFFLVVGGLLPGFELQAAEVLHVFAAASTSEAMTEIAHKFEAENGVDVRLNLASSGTLARQIEHGAPCDLFISANIRWMDHLEKQGRLLNETRRNLLGNQLILIAPKGQAFGVDMKRGFNLAGAFSGWLALGNPDYVPVGMYAKEALKSLGWWDAVQERIFPCKDAPATVTMALRGEAGAAVVYSTDIHGVDGVEKIAVFPIETHAPIIYPAALCEGCGKDAEIFLNYLSGEDARSVFRGYGLVPL